ncbi:hypothetical protein [Anabaena sp. CA = ATCC 33047]|uniref:hypothetical protein n=1 Tax=Anabaena sp. (strain CA / ATCC 33047) TaxID=52271 RepID=UPI000AD70521|nr:hypothetical protein [Anabaena sp. CA = ATCC 33047]
MKPNIVEGVGFPYVNPTYNFTRPLAKICALTFASLRLPCGFRFSGMRELLKELRSNTKVLMQEV